MQRAARNLPKPESKGKTREPQLRAPTSTPANLISLLLLLLFAKTRYYQNLPQI